MADIRSQAQGKMTNTHTQPGQNAQTDGQRAILEGISSPGTVTHHQMQPRFSNWPTSKPGPLARQPPLGQRPINALRSEQEVEVGYNQAVAKPSTYDTQRYLPDRSLKGRAGFDQLEMMQEAVQNMANVEEVLLARIPPLTCYTIHSLMKAVGKCYVLQGYHPITLFAPSDAAFDALREGALYDLLKDVRKLEHLMDFHLVPMELTRSDMVSLASELADQEPEVVPNAVDATVPARPRTLQVETLSGHPLTVTLTEELRVNGVKVCEADLVADNGVVHVLENILWPPELSEASFSERSPLIVHGQESLLR